MKYFGNAIFGIALVLFGCNTGINSTSPQNNFIGKWKAVYCLNSYYDSTQNIKHDTLIYVNNLNSKLNAYLELTNDTLAYYAYLNSDTVYYVNKSKYIESNDSLIILSNISSMYYSAGYSLKQYSYLIKNDSLIEYYDLLLKGNSDPNYYFLFPEATSTITYCRFSGNIPLSNWPSKSIITQ